MALLFVIFCSGSAYKDNLEPDQIAGGLSTATQNRQQNVSVV